MKNDGITLKQQRPNKRWKNFVRLYRIAYSEGVSITVGLTALVVNSITNLSFPWIVGKALDGSNDGQQSDGEPQLLNKFLIGSSLFFLFGSAASFVRVYCLGVATERIESKLSQQLFDNYMKKDMEFFDANQTGELITLLDKDIRESALVFTEKLASGLRSINSSLNGSILLFITSPKLCVVSLSVVPIIGIGAMTLSKNSRLYSDKLRVIQSDVISYALERFSNFSTVKLNGKEGDEMRTFANYMEQCVAIASDRHSSYGVFMAFIGLTTNLSLLAVMKVGGSMLANKEITSGQLTRFAIQTAFVGLGFSGLSTFYSDMMKAIDASGRVFDMMDASEPSEPVLEASRSTDGISSSMTNIDTLIEMKDCVDVGDKSKATEKVLEFKAVSFVYSLRPQHTVLQNLNVTIYKAKITCIIGKSGSGKSTMAALTSGLYRPKEGSILYYFNNDEKEGQEERRRGAREVNRESSKSQLSEIQKRIGVVEQSSKTLFNTSILENILYGKLPGSQVSLEKVKAAAQLASAPEFITAMPNGYDTNVGEQGKLLSGGQQSRIALARALLKDPDILVLDEATSSLDSQSEQEIVDILIRLRDERKKSILIFSHSEYIQQKADFVHRIEDGCIK